MTDVIVSKMDWPDMRLRTWSLLVEVLNALGSGLVFVVMVFLTCDIGGRILFNAPLAGVPELSSMAIVSIVFLQVPHAIRSDSLVRSTLVYDAIVSKAPRLGALLSVIFDLAGAAIFAAVAWGSWPAFTRALSNGDQYGTPGVFLFPQWPARFLVIACCTVAALQYAVSAIGHLRAVVWGIPKPHAIVSGDWKARP